MSVQDQVFAIIDPLRRCPSTAQIGGFRPKPGLRSWFGGGFYLPTGTAWPQLAGKDAIPLLQIVTGELPNCPIQLAPFAVVQVFIDPTKLPVVDIAKNGDGFLVNCYRDTNSLQPASNEPVLERPKKFPVLWTKGNPEGPDWQDTAGLLDQNLVSLFVAEQDCFAVYSDRYFGHTHTKVGGWAMYIQGGPAKKIGEFVLQIASEAKPFWMVGDNGNLYFYVDDGGNWQMHWDCY